MRLGAWWIIGGTCALVAVVCIGCPSDPPPPPTHDSGVCMLYDFGLDETEAEADAGDDAEAETEAEAEPDTDLDADTATDAEPDAASEAEAAADASVDADVGEASSLPDLTPKVCRTDVDAVIFVSCAFTSCHGRYPDGQSGLYLGKTGDWTKNVIDVRSKERKDLVRVKPGDPKNSWLAHKIVGDQCMFASKCVDGDCGDQMPATNQPLNSSDMNTILDWIQQGADPDPTCGGTK